jgi:hypothetical protein
MEYGNENEHLLPCDNATYLFNAKYRPGRVEKVAWVR